MIFLQTPVPDISSKIDFNQLPLWVLLVTWMALILYRDMIKPRAERKLNQDLEIEKRNKEIQKYNEDQKKWEIVFGTIQGSNKKLEDLTNAIINLVNKDIDNISEGAAIIIITAIFQNSATKLKALIIHIIKNNHRKLPIRQDYLKTSISSLISTDFHETHSLLKSFCYKGSPLSVILDDISECHKEAFQTSLFYTMFEMDGDDYIVENDMISQIDSDYRGHISDGIKYIKSKK